MKTKPEISQHSKCKLPPVEFLVKKKKIIKRRSDLKFTSNVLRQREYQDRKNKGYIHLVFVGKEKELFDYLKKCIDPLSLHNPYKGIIGKIEFDLKANRTNKTWKIEDEDFRLYHFQNITKSFELYLKEDKYLKVMIVQDKIKILHGPRPKYSPVLDLNTPTIKGEDSV